MKGECEADDVEKTDLTCIQKTGGQHFQLSCKTVGIVVKFV